MHLTVTNRDTLSLAQMYKGSGTASELSLSTEKGVYIMTFSANPNEYSFQQINVSFVTGNANCAQCTPLIVSLFIIASTTVQWFICC